MVDASLKPFANGLLAIFRRVIWNKYNVRMRRYAWLCYSMLSKRASGAALNTGLGSYYGIHKYSAESLTVSSVGMYTYHWDFTLILAYIC